ncbi:MAG: hypothetical protein Q9226_007979 [Calogaya cf. arnoldii]
MAHGFYVLMGGLAFSIPADLSESEQFVPSWACGTWFITQTGLWTLLKLDIDQVPSLSKEEIKSKSKANGLAKALVCAQAIWFLATCITRLAQGIPISLLELNTFGHAVCALFIYLLWWEKPFEVDIPTRVHSKALLDVFALIWVNTRGQSPLIRSMKQAYQDLLQANEQFQKLDMTTKRKLSTDYPRDEADLVESLDRIAWFEISFQRLRRGFPLKIPANQSGINEHLASTKFTPGETIPFTGLQLKSTLRLYGMTLLPTRFYPALPSLSLTRQDINRWKMAKRAAEINNHEPLARERGDVYRRLDPFVRRCFDTPVRRYFNTPVFADVLVELPQALGFGVAALIYGGLHALAWFANFHSPTEQLLWRISSVAVMGGIPVLAVNYALLDLIRKRFPKYVYPEIAILVGKPALILFYLVAIAYILARLYLVVECFIQLSHLPAGVYDVPAWSAYFPHIA